MSAKSEVEESSNRFKLNFSPLLASIPAALAAAVVGSRLGVQGTLVGAALTAVASGVVSQFATFGIERSHAGLKLVVARRDESGEPELVEVPLTDDQAAALDAATSSSARPSGSASSEASAPARMRRAVHPGWVLGGIVTTALLTFGVTLGVLTVIEAGAGRSVDGGYSTTVSGAARGNAAAAHPQPTPTTSAPVAPVTSVTPSPEPTPTAAAPASASPSAASESPAAEPSVAPTPASVPSTTNATSEASSLGQTQSPAAGSTQPSQP